MKKPIFFLISFVLFLIISSFSFIHAANILPPTYCGRFQDIPEGSTFYEYIRVLGCNEAISGYECGGAGEPCMAPNNYPYFRPGVSLTRGQGAKIITVSARMNETVTGQTFEDILPGSPFYEPIERLVGRGIIGGYACGGTGEPCIAPNNRSYFRQNTDLTRAQLAKITAMAMGRIENASGQTFEDILPGSPFYQYIEYLAKRNIISGYACGGVGEPCIAPGNRPYFRQNASVTRQQASKYVALAFFANQVTPALSPTPTNTPIGLTPNPSFTPPPVPPGQCPKKSLGDADCNGVVDNIDYNYYVTVVNGGNVPANVNADFNNDGEVGARDRGIIIHTLNGGK